MKVVTKMRIIKSYWKECFRCEHAAAMRRYFGTFSIVKVRMINKKYGIDPLRIL
jgi:hypothetical protein